MITSTQNQRVKLVRLLQTQSKARRREGKLVLEGHRLVDDALQQGYVPDFMFYSEDDVLPDAQQVTPELMRYMSDTQQPQGVLAVFPLPDLPLPQAPRRVLILDALGDPGNLGTVLRAAAASGTQAVLLAPDCVDPYNPKVLRAGMGAHFRVPLARMNWDEIHAYCENLKLYLADSQGTTPYDQVDWRHPWGLIVGNEAHGEGQAARDLAQIRIVIPMAAASKSINAALAAGIILFEAQRQTR